VYRSSLFFSWGQFRRCALGIEYVQAIMRHLKIFFQDAVLIFGQIVGIAQ